MKKQRKGAVSHHKLEVEELRDDRALAEAYGGLGAIATQAGISREALYRSLSTKGNPTLKTLLAVLKAVGMRLSVEPEKRAA